MSERERYYAYVGTYTSGKSEGIYLYDVNVEEGTLAFRKVIPLRNPSYLIAARNKQVIYSIADTGVVAFRVEEDGDLTEMNQADIGGMRGCHLAIDREDQYIYVAGYHDGRVSMLNLSQDGSLGELLDGIFHHGQGGVNERSFHPHISCVRMTPDNRFLCAVDSSLDQVVFYKRNPILNKLQEVEIERMGREVGPRTIHFSKDGRYAYLLCELSCTLRIYRYTTDEKTPHFELADEVSVIPGDPDIHDAAYALRLSDDGAYLYCSTAGSNLISCFQVDPISGLLTKEFMLPASGDYPKDVVIFPDGKHIASVNNGAGTITTFAVRHEEKYISMFGRPQIIDKPNCMIFVRKP